MTLINALNEVRDELKAGAALDSALVEEIAAENGVNPALLTRKLAESGITEAGVRAYAQATDPKAALAAKVQANIAAMCKRYGVSDGVTKLTGRDGEVYHVVCQIHSCTVWRYRAVRASDGAQVKVAHNVL